MKQFFTKMFLAVVAFSLFIGVTNVAYGEEEPAPVSGVCDIRNGTTNAPTFYLPDLGVGYAKKTQLGIDTIAGLRAACTKKVYEELLRQYCKQNSEPVQRGVIIYNEEGKVYSTGGSAFGSDYVYCNSLGFDSSVITGACGLRGNANAPGFFDPDIGVGYIKKAQPGVNSVEGLREVCTLKVYQELLIDYCKQNSEPVQPEVITYGEGGGYESVGGSAFGSDPFYCNSIGADPSKITGVCELRSGTATSVPGFFDPDIGADYVKKAQPGVNSVGGLQDVCTRELYEELLIDYCKQTTEPALPRVVTYGEGGGYRSVGSSALGSGETMSCPVEEVPVEEVSTVSFPILELGNCGSEGECHDYCEDLEHASACIAYAKANNLLTKEDEKKLDEFSDVIESGGPGGCKTEESCGTYCEDTAHLNECLGFVRKHNLLNDDEIKEVEKAVEAIENGGPGGCTKEEECRVYCKNNNNIGECADFAEKFDLATPDELEEMRKLAAAKEAGVSFPGNCKDKEGCLAYCDNSAHQIVCMEFAQEAGLLKGEDIEAVAKIIPYLKQGGKLPGGCTSKESCDAYCDNDTHSSECVDFAVSVGFMNKEEAEIVKKVGGKGPGNCKSREACDNYCKSEEHIDECINFAVKAGLVSQEDAEMAKKFGISSGGPGGCKSKAECQSFCTLPDNQETCSSWGKEHGIDMSSGPGGQAGPGGCKSQKECMAYCKDHQEECQNFTPPSGGTGFSGPGGCKNKEECTAYCTANQGDEECKKMMEQFGGPSGSGRQDESGGCEVNTSGCSGFESPNGGDQSQTPPSGNSGAGFSGPGGCKSQEECNAYCMNHPQECQNFAPPSGSGEPSGGGEPIYQPPPDFTGPGGCKSQEECQTYCTQNYQDPACQQFAHPSGGGDQSGIPQGYSSWEEFCKANSGDSRCASYQQQQYPLLLRYQPFAAILNFILGR